MASIKKLPSGSWRARVYTGKDESGKAIYKSFTADTKAEVEYMAAQFAKDKGVLVRSKPQEITVLQAIDKYISLSESLSPTTLQSYERIKRYAFADIMNVSVNELDDIDMQAAINREAKRKTEQTGKVLSPKTVKNEWSLVSAALKTVCSKTYIVRLPKIQREVEMLPEPSEVIEAIKGTDIELPCLLAMWCGMRMSEIRGLTDSSVKGDYIIVSDTVVDVNNVPVRKSDTKTAASKRKLKLPPYLLELINISIEQQKSLYGGVIAPKGDIPIVPMTRDSIYMKFKRLTTKRGLDISFHDLRHLYASVSLSILGLPPKSVQVSGGWKTMDVMNNTYSQSFNKMQEQADNARNNYFQSIIDR